MPQGTPDPFAIEAAHNFPYEAPNLYIDYLQHEVGLEVGYWRSVSHALNCFAIESFMDELAAEAQMDLSPPLRASRAPQGAMRVDRRSRIHRILGLLARCPLGNVAYGVRGKAR